MCFVFSLKDISSLKIYRISIKKRLKYSSFYISLVSPDRQFNNLAPYICNEHVLSSRINDHSCIFLFYIFKEKKFSLYYLIIHFSFYLFVLQYDYVFCIILLQFILFYRAIYFSCRINFVSMPFSFYHKYLSIYLLFVSTLFMKEKELS